MREVIVLGFRSYETKEDVEDFKGYFHGFFTEGNQEEGLETMALVERKEDGRVFKLWKLQNMKFI